MEFLFTGRRPGQNCSSCHPLSRPHQYVQLDHVSGKIILLFQTLSMCAADMPGSPRRPLHPMGNIFRKLLFMENILELEYQNITIFKITILIICFIDFAFMQDIYIR